MTVAQPTLAQLDASRLAASDCWTNEGGAVLQPQAAHR
jgi:hypothetical protein